MPFEDWDDVGPALLRALGLLMDGDFLVLGEPTGRRGRASRFLHRRSKPAPCRYVQVLRVGEIFTAECVGATSLGGTWAMRQATIEQLQNLGWRTPAETRREFGHVTPNFDLYVALAAAPTLTDLLVASLELLGARPEDLTLETSS